MTNGHSRGGMRRRTFLSAFGATGLLAAATGCAGRTSADAEYTITAGHGATTDHFHHLSYEHFASLVEENSGGRITVTVHPNAVFGGDREVIEHVQLNNLQVGLPSAAPLAAFVPAMNIWEVPYLFESPEHAYRTVDSPFGADVLGKLENYGMIGLEYWDNGFRNLTTRNTAVTSPADLDGLSIRTLENTAHIRAWQALGANPTPMAFGEVYVGLQQGTIQAQENPLPLIESQRFYEVQNYAVLTRHIYNPSPFLINEAFFRDLPGSLQDAVLEAAADTRDFCRKAGEEADAQALETISDSGTEIIELSSEQREAFAEPMQEGAESFIEQVAGKDLVDQLHAAVEESA